MARSRPIGAALALGLAATIAQADGLYLFVIPTTVRDAAVEPRLPLRIAAYVPEPRAFQARLGLPESTVLADRVEFELGHEIRLAPAPPGSFLASTFLVDHEEPAVRALRERLIEQRGARPTPQDLIEFVRQTIDHHVLGRGWDAASRVAATHTGDCTEHAVLLAALARSVGRPARVVVGAVLVTDGGRFATLGHAWNELYDGERWHTADAAIAPGAAPLGYLPFGVLDDEGPGHMLAVVHLSATTWVRRVEILGNG
jgi:transglutaminase-like putative cysteine protease